MINRDYSSLKAFKSILKELNNNMPSNFDVNYIEQIIFFIDALVKKNIDKDLSSAFDLLDHAIKLTNPNFNIKNIKNYKLHGFENRLANNIIILLTHLYEYDLSLSLAEHLLDNLSVIEPIYLTILYNYACCLYSMDRNSSAYEICSLGQFLAKKNNNNKSMILFTYLKALIEHEIGKDSFCDSINLSLDISNTNKNFKTLNKLIRKNSVRILGLRYSESIEGFII